MKILQLKLVAYGLFTDLALDFSQTQAGLHIIYGANEAGKSSTRRALTHLLFGIPERTTDAYLHASDKLLLGAQLQNGNLEELRCYRRKGRKNTLLDEQMNPLDESVLQSFLGGMNEAQFTALFCFDHEHLRQGGEDLLNGGGDVGESLFEAGTGQLKLHEVLATLDKEADDLFKVRGAKPRLNQTIRVYKEAVQRVKECTLSASKWSQHAKALEDARNKHTQLSTHLRTLHAEQRRLARVQHTRPLLQRQQELRVELISLANVLILPDDAAAKRIQTSLALRTAQSQEKQAKQILTELQNQLVNLLIPANLLAQKTTIDSLRERLGSHQKAARDLPGVRTEMRTVESEAMALLRRIYPDDRSQSISDDRSLSLSKENPSTTENLLKNSPLFITNQQRDRLKQLADNYPALREKQASLKERLEKLSQQLTQQQALFNNLPQSPDLTILKAALNRALKQGELEQTLAKDDKEVRLLTVKAEINLKQLGLWSGSLESLEVVPLPGMERVDSFDRHFKEIDNDRQRIKERLLEARNRYTKATQKIDALRWAGEVPTEQALVDARQVRQQRWQTLKHTQATVEMFRVFEEAMAYADELADRLRREAHRVAEQANLLAEQQSAQTEQEQLSKKWRINTDLLATLQNEWEDCWKPLNIKAWSPAEMRSWLAECLALRQQMSLLRERRQQLQVRQQLIADLCQELSSALAQLPQATMPLTRLVDLIEQAQACIADMTNLQRQREDLDKQVKTLSIEQQKLDISVQQASAALQQWQTEWVHAIAPLQLPADTPPDIARNVLDTLDQVVNKLDKVSGLRRRVERMDEDAAVFRQEVATLVQAIAPELTNEIAEKVVPILSERLSQAEKDATRYEQLQQRLQVEQQRATRASEAIQAAQAELQVLLEQAGCHELVALEMAEQASLRKKTLQQQLVEIDQQLLEQGEGMSVEELTNAAAAVDIDQLPEQLRICTEQIQQLEQERSGFDQNIGELRSELKRMDGNAAAAQAADEAQLALAEIQELSERYMQIHLAAIVLRRSIERYREQHQGPLLQRASELFKRLTLGSFCGLKSDYNSNDQPILLGLRHADNDGIPTSGMSDGTRDQLYLALRLASIERYIDKHIPLPLILDDILINFDDERSRATLEILAELGEKTQILFFTHHSRLVELAQATVKQGKLVTHRL